MPRGDLSGGGRAGGVWALLLSGCFAPEVVRLPDFEAGEGAAIAAIPIDRNGQTEQRAVLFTPDRPEVTRALVVEAANLELYLAYFRGSASDLRLEPGLLSAVEGDEPLPFEDASRTLRLDGRAQIPVELAELPPSMRALTRPRTSACQVLQVERRIEPECDRPSSGREEPVSLTSLHDGRALLLTRRGCFFEVTAQGIRRATALEASYASVAPAAAVRPSSTFADQVGHLWIGARDHTLVEITGDPIDAPQARLHLHAPAMNGTQGRHQLVRLDGAPDGSELFATALYGDLIRLDTKTATFSQIRSGAIEEGRLAWLGPGRAASVGAEGEVLLYDQGNFARFALAPGSSASAIGRGPNGSAYLGLPRLEIAALTWPGPNLSSAGPLYAHPNQLLPWGESLLYVGEAGLLGQWRADVDCAFDQQTLGDYSLRWLVPLSGDLLVATGAPYVVGSYSLHFIRVSDRPPP